MGVKFNLIHRMNETGRLRSFRVMALIGCLFTVSFGIRALPCLHNHPLFSRRFFLFSGFIIPPCHVDKHQTYVYYAISAFLILKPPNQRTWSFPFSIYRTRGSRAPLPIATSDRQILSQYHEIRKTGPPSAEKPPHLLIMRVRFSREGREKRDKPL